MPIPIFKMLRPKLWSLYYSTANPSGNSSASAFKHRIRPPLINVRLLTWSKMWAFLTWTGVVVLNWALCFYPSPDILLSTQQTKRSFQTIRPFSALDLHWLHTSLWDNQGPIHCDLTSHRLTSPISSPLLLTLPLSFSSLTPRQPHSLLGFFAMIFMLGCFSL